MDVRNLLQTFTNAIVIIKSLIITRRKTHEIYFDNHFLLFIHLFMDTHLLEMLRFLTLVIQKNLIKFKQTKVSLRYTSKGILGGSVLLIDKVGAK